MKFANVSSYSVFIAGLDPAIRRLCKMDHRVTRLWRGPVMTLVLTKGDLR